MPKNIPVVCIEEESLAAAYEAALKALYEQGVEFETQYDRPGDPKSLDCTMNITINAPMSEPMIHKGFPGGIEDLKEYVMELKGLKDHWVKNINDPEDTRWEYTYHGRLSNYGVWKELQDGESVEVGPFKVKQIEMVVDKLSNQPFTRQAQMITWMPNLDLECYDPPCLQSIWYRIQEDDDGVWWLNTNIRFRSNDAWGANFMNMFGYVMFSKEMIADAVAERTGKTVKLGRLNWQADSYHIYGKDIEYARERLINRIETTDFEDRVYEFSDEIIREIYDEAEEAVLKKIKAYDEEHSK
ncbi:MAG: thymidylate synthase [Verrucomicrobiota bacterium]